MIMMIHIKSVVLVKGQLLSSPLPFRTGISVAVQCRILQQLQKLPDSGHDATGGGIFLLL